MEDSPSPAVLPPKRIKRSTVKRDAQAHVTLLATQLADLRRYASERGESVSAVIERLLNQNGIIKAVAI
jgi:hypothetical protein